MKDVGYGVGSILSECERIESVFVNNTETTESIVSCSLTLMLPASTYTKTAGAATSSVVNLGFASVQVEVGV